MRADLTIAAVRQRLGSADVLLLGTVLVWSFHFVVIKYALSHGFPPLVYATIRFGVGSLIFAGITYGRERSLRVGRRDLILLGGVVAIAMYLNQISFATAIDLTTASTVALLFGTLPIFVALIAWALGTERPHPRHWIATGLSFGGVALVAAGAGGGLSGDLGGILIGLVAPITWALYSVVSAPLLRRYSPYRISAVVGLAAIVPLAVTAAPAIASEQWSAVTALAWLSLAYSILLCLRPDERPVVPGDRQGRCEPLLPLLEPPAVSRRTVRGARAGRDAWSPPDRRRDRHRRRHPCRAASQGPRRDRRLTLSWP